jgi:hypothetical protein
MIFPAIHHAMKFCLLILKPTTDDSATCFVFFARQIASLTDVERRFTLSPSDIARINPNTHTAPLFRSRADAELATKIYSRIPIFVDEGNGAIGNPWSFKMHSRLWHMAEDAAWFKSVNELTALGRLARERHGSPQTARDSCLFTKEKCSTCMTIVGRPSVRLLTMRRGKSLLIENLRTLTFSRGTGYQSQR